MRRTRRPWGMRTLPLRLETLEERALLSIFGRSIFPADNPWNQRVDRAPVAANSATLVSSIGLNATVHADFGATLWDGGYIGIPWNIVTGTQPRVPVVLDAYGSESDHVTVPIPANAVIEGDPRPSNQNTGDRHLLVYDRDNNVLYEGFNVHRPSETGDGQWHADSLAYWDLNTNYFRPAGWTSADAAGLPILPGLVRAEEISERGRIEHPIRVTVPRSRNQYVFPASHHAGSNNAALPRMGERFRLRQDFDISGFSPTNRIILTAMKEYGLIVADNGSPWYLSGIPSSLWDDDDLHALGSVRGSDFEAVDLTPQVAALDRAAGPTTGGFQVTISGLNLSGAAGQFQVFFGTTAATGVTVLSDTQVVATAPALPAGSVSVTVRSPYGTSAVVPAGAFTFAEPGPAQGLFQFAARTFRVNETDAAAIITVLRTGGSAGAVTVHYAMGGGTATAGSDYTAVAGILSFAAGETSKTFQVPLHDDAAVEGRESVRLTLGSPTGGAGLGTPSFASLVLRDNDGTAHERYVSQTYQDVLGRPVEPAGLRAWVELLGQGHPHGVVGAAIVGSYEQRANVVRAAYQQFLGRDAEPGGLAGWVEFLGRGSSEDDLRAGLLGSEEFFARSGGTNNTFLAELYEQVLDRGIEPAGAQAWEEVLRQGVSRGLVAQAVLWSDERLRLRAQAFYDRMLNRDADAAGLEGFVAYLRQRGREEVILAAMAASPEYVSFAD